MHSEFLRERGGVIFKSYEEEVALSKGGNGLLLQSCEDLALSGIGQASKGGSR